MAPKETWIDKHGLIISEDDADKDALIGKDTETKNLLKQNEVAIDGVIYDLDGFYHPGGDSIQVFGGNDVTVMYKMIHPHHTKDYHTKKMNKVGLLNSYQSEYKWDTEFAAELKSEVFKIVPRGKEFGTPGYFARAIFYVVLYFYLQYHWVTHGSSYGLAIWYGICCALIGLNVQHDGNHGAASKKTWVNDLLGFGADLIGGNKWIWMEKHWTHHAYTNHKDKDPDGISAEPMIIFNQYPKDHPGRRWYHSFQAILFIPVLSLYWLSTMFNLDVVELADANAESAGMHFHNSFTEKRRKFAILSRILHAYVHLIIPFQHHGMTWTALGHVLVFGAAGSLSLGLLFVLSHNFEGADRDPTAEARRSGGQVCWYKAQCETSSTYGGFISGALTGGLNFQVEHHLFPRMSSAWYPYIAPTVREVCKKHGVKYTYYPWVWQNMISTFKYVHSMGKAVDEKEKTP